MTLSIAIVGCGTAGQASAIFLSRMGHRVTVFERAGTPSPVGAGLLLQPTGMAVLDQLGVGRRVRELGSPVRRLVGTTVGGRTVLDLAYTDLHPDVHGIGIHRGALFSTLHSAMLASSVTLFTGAEIASLSHQTESVSCVAKDGTQHGPFDVLILADGARSTLRPQCTRVVRARQYPWSALWFVATDPDARFAGVLRQVYCDTRKMIGFLPSGRVENGGPQTISIFWSIRDAELNIVRSRGLESWKQDALALCPDAQPLIDQVRAMDQLIYAPYYDVVLRDCVGRRTICIGDAAHATSPQLGQGANLALRDAAAIADAFSHYECNTHSVLRSAAEARRRQVQFYQNISRWLTPVFQSRAYWIAPARDVLYAPLSRVPWISRQMALSLCGLKTGLLSNEPIPMTQA